MPKPSKKPSKSKPERCPICGLIIAADSIDDHHRECDTAACEEVDRKYQEKKRGHTEAK